jgi:hypothetical protein
MYKSFQEYLDVKKHKGKGKLVTKPPVEEVPDFHGDANKTEKPHKEKNIKDNQVIEQMTSFQEYLKAKGHSGKPIMQEKPNVGGWGDEDFDDENAPPTETIPPTEAPVKAGKPHPYRGTNIKLNSDKGFGDLGVDEPYVPKIDVAKDTQYKQAMPGSEKGVPQVPSGENPPKGGTSPLVKDGAPQVKEMSLPELTNYLAEKNNWMENNLLLENCGGCEDGIPMVTSFAKGKFHPNPLEAIEYITHLASQNSDLMETLVRQLKKKEGGMSGLMGSVMDQPEGLKEIALGLDGEKGSDTAGNICRALNDLYEDYRGQFEGFSESALSAPLGFEDDEEEEGVDDKEEEDDDTFDQLPDDEGEGLGDLGDIKAGEEEDDEDFDFGDDDDEEPGPEDEEEDDLPDLPDRKEKKRKRFGHDNMVDAMGNHPQMMSAMVKRCRV